MSKTGIGIVIGVLGDIIELFFNSILYNEHVKIAISLQHELKVNVVKYRVST